MTTATTDTRNMRRPSERPASPERWRAALDRARTAGISVEQRDSRDRCLWTVRSATEPGKERLIMVIDGVPVRCDCVASDYGDPVCLHRAAYYAAVGHPALIDTPERLAA